MSQAQATESDVTLSLWGKRPFVFVNGDLPEPAIASIEEELSYYKDDYEYTDAWKQGDWDGKVHLFKESQNGNYYFPVGLLDRVRMVLDTIGVDYEVEGLNRPGRGDMGYEWVSDMTPRGYQETAVGKALAYGSGVIAMPTGSGKTFVGVRLINELDHPALIVVDNAEVADQWVEAFDEYLGVDASRYYGGTRECGDVQVALYQSIYMDGEIVDDVRLDHPVVIADECHSVGASTFNEVAMSTTAPYRYGLSATPERSDNAELRVFGGLGPLIVDLSVEKMIEKGFLATPEWRIEDAPSSGKSYHGDWKQEYEEEIVKNERRNKRIATIVNGELERPTLVTVERINHGEYLEARIDDAEFVHGSASDRSENIQAFRDGDLPVLIATRGIVGEGFDVPEIASFVIAGGLKSEVSMIQQVGRALRPDTETATIVDFYDRGQFVGNHSGERLKTYQEYYGEKYGPL